jgi:hypothetical protein
VITAETLSFDGTTYALNLDIGEGHIARHYPVLKSIHAVCLLIRLSSA